VEKKKPSSGEKEENLFSHWASRRPFHRDICWKNTIFSRGKPTTRGGEWTATIGKKKVLLGIRGWSRPLPTGETTGGGVCRHRMIVSLVNNIRIKKKVGKLKSRILSQRAPQEKFLKGLGRSRRSLSSGKGRRGGTQVPRLRALQ